MNKLIAFIAVWPVVLVCTAIFGGGGYLVLQLAGSLRSEFSLLMLVFGVLLYAFILGSTALGHVRESDGFGEPLVGTLKMGSLLWVTLLGGAAGVLVEHALQPGTRAELGGPLGVVVAFFIIVGISYVYSGTQTGNSTVIRGRELAHLEQVAAKAAANLSGQGAEVWWAGFQHPSSVAESNFCVVGAPGSGKTLTLQMFMDPILPRIVPGSNTRALLYDAKCDLLSYLSTLGIPAERIHVLNPFDKRSVAWDMAADIDAPAIAQQVASVLIPIEEGPNRFFSDAARALLTGVFNAFILDGSGAWTFRDVIVAMQDTDRLRQVLGRHEVTRPLIEEYFEPPDLFRNIKATIASYMAGYQTVAALWHTAHCQPPLSLRDWIKSDSILVLGNDDSLRAPLDAINRVLFQRASELLLSRSRSRSCGQ